MDARASQANDAAGLITRLEKIDPGVYFDMHGNAHEYLQELMIARFRVTHEITRSINRLERDGGHPELVGALYRVLGFVKDPASIDWLTTRVASPSGSALFYAHWLPRWQDTTDVMEHGNGLKVANVGLSSLWARSSAKPTRTDGSNCSEYLQGSMTALS